MRMRRLRKLKKQHRFLIKKLKLTRNYMPNRRNLNFLQNKKLAQLRTFATFFYYPYKLLHPETFEIDGETRQSVPIKLNRKQLRRRLKKDKYLTKRSKQLFFRMSLKVRKKQLFLAQVTARFYRIFMKHKKKGINLLSAFAKLRQKAIQKVLGESEIEKKIPLPIPRIFMERDIKKGNFQAIRYGRSKVFSHNFIKESILFLEGE